MTTGAKTAAKAKKPAAKRAKPKPPGYVFGRPTLYKPEYCQKVIDLGRKGYSVVQMCADLGISRNTLETEWPANYPDFSQAMADARAFSQAWWESEGQKALRSKTFNSAVWNRSMGARFPKDWRESTKQEHSGPDGKPIEIEAKSEMVSEIIGVLRGLRRQGSPDE